MPEPLSRAFLLEQGACCGSGCRNCPYVPRHVAGATWVDRVDEAAEPADDL